MNISDNAYSQLQPQMKEVRRLLSPFALLQNHYLTYRACVYIGPSAPIDVQGFCNVVGWKIPRVPNGQLLSYDVQVHITATDEEEIKTVTSDQTYVYLGKRLTHQHGEVLVRVIQTLIL